MPIVVKHGLRAANEWTADFVDLTEYAGNSNVRIIFVVTSAGGNNLYLDNLEFFLSNDQNPVEIPENTLSLYPNPTKDITESLSICQNWRL